MSPYSVRAQGSCVLTAMMVGMTLLSFALGGCHGQIHRGGISFGLSDTPEGFRRSFEMPEERERRRESIPPEHRSKVKPKIGEGTVIDESEEKPPKPEKSEAAPESEPEVDEEGAPAEKPKKGEPSKAPRR